MKDAKGHGSEARGGGSYHNIDNNLRGPGKHVGYSAGGDVWHIQKSNGPKSDWYSGTRQGNGDTVSGKGLGAISRKLQADSDTWRARALGVSGGQPVSSNAHAAATLASGPKSVPVETHPGAPGQKQSWDAKRGSYKKGFAG